MQGLGNIDENDWISNGDILEIEEREVGVTLRLISFTSGIPNVLKQLLSIFLEVFSTGGSALIIFLWSFCP